MNTPKSMADFPPFTPNLEGFQREEFHRQSLSLLEFAVTHDEQALDLAPFVIDPPPPPLDPPLPLLPAVWYPRPAQGVREWVLAHLSPPRLAEVQGKTRTVEAQIVMRPLLAGNGPVTIRGESGQGKSTLLAYIAGHERTRQRYRRIWWLDNPTQVLQTLALALNLPRVISESDSVAQCALLQPALPDNTLLILDNLSEEQSAVFKNLTPHLLMGVETLPEEESEAPPPDPPNVLTVRALSKIDAFDLFADACGMVDKKEVRGQMRAWMSHITRLLGGHPLALVIAGALFREDGFPMEKLVDLFSERIDAQTPKPDVAIDISLEAIPGDYTDLLKAFGALPPAGASFEALMATARLRGELAGHRALSFLIKHGLVSRDTRYKDRYVAHPLVWQRVEAKNPHAPGNEFGDRLRQWVMREARRHSEDAAQLYPIQNEILHTLDMAQRYHQEDVIHKLNMTLGSYFREYAPAYLMPNAPPVRLTGERAQAAKLMRDGLDHLQKNKPDEARVALDEALKMAEQYGSDHEIAEVLTAQAYWANELKKYGDAVQLLEKAAKLVFDLEAEDSLHVTRLGLAMLYRKQGRLRDALGVLDDAPDTAAERARIYQAGEQWELMIEALASAGDISPYTRAEIYLQAKKYADALQALAEEQDNRSAFLRATIYHLQGDLETAIRGYHLAAETIPRRDARRVRILQRIGMAYAIQRDYESGRKSFIQALEIIPTLTESADDLKGRTLALLGALCLADQEVAKAIEFCTQALESYERAGAETAVRDLANVHRTLGRAYWRRGDKKKALGAFEGEVQHAQSILPREEERIGIALHHLGSAYEFNGESERAIANYRRALTHKNPQAHPQSYFMTQVALFRLLYRLERYKPASELSEAAIKHLDAHPPVDLQYLGYMLCIHSRVEQGLEHHAQAEKTFGRWLTVLAGSSDALHDTARPFLGLLALMLAVRSLLYSQRAAEAQSLAEVALALAEKYYPGTSLAWSTRRDLGIAEAKLGIFQKAIETLVPLLYEPVREEIFTYALAHEQSGIAYASLGDSEKALEFLQRAYELQPVAHIQGSILERIGDIYVERQEHGAAIQHFQQALTLLDPLHQPEKIGQVFVKLAMAQTQLGYYTDAVKSYDTALEALRAVPDTDMLQLARIYINFAANHEVLGQYPQAAIAYRNALDTLRSARLAIMPEDYRKALMRLAAVQVIQQRYDDAIGLFLQARDETQKHGTPLEQAQGITILADTYLTAGKVESALQAYEDALAVVGSGKSPYEQAAALRGYGQALARVGRFDEARRAWGEALSLTTDAPALEIALTYRAIGQAYHAQNMYAEAEKSLRDALSYHQPGTVEAAESARLLGITLLEAKRYSDAIVPLQQALDIEKSLPQQINLRIVDTLQKLAQAHELCNNFSAAIAGLHEALVYMDKNAQPLQYAVQLRQLGRLYTIQQRWKETHKALEEALDIEFKYKPRSDARIAQTLEMIAVAYRREGQLEKAADAYRRLASYANLSKSAADDLKKTQDELERYKSTLQVAQESARVLESTGMPDIKDLVYVYALIAQNQALLSQFDTANATIDKLLSALEKNPDKFSIVDERAPYRALAHVFEGSQAASEGDLVEARAHFQRALHDTTDLAMRWVITQGLNSVQEK